MAFYDDTAKNAMLNQLATLCTKLALHTADPGTGSSNEVSGGGYARQTVTWAAASGGAMAPSGDVTFDIAAGVTVAYITGWNSTGTVRYFKYDVTNQTFTNAGQYTVLAGSSSVNLNA